MPAIEDCIRMLIRDGIEPERAAFLTEEILKLRDGITAKMGGPCTEGELAREVMKMVAARRAVLVARRRKVLRGIIKRHARKEDLAKLTRPGVPRMGSRSGFRASAKPFDAAVGL